MRNRSSASFASAIAANDLGKVASLTPHWCSAEHYLRQLLGA